MKLPEGVKMTPMLRQYSEWKDKYPDCLLLFRMGDFFELFFDDAVTASEVLDITLTARDQEKAIPMAGVPHHALDAYMGRLIAAGYRVAVCDQMTAPDGKTLVERSVVRLVTPGTYVPQDSEGDGKLAAVFFSGEMASIALLTSGTGLLEAGTFPRDEALSLVSSFAPGELLLAKGQEGEFDLSASEGLAMSGARPMIVARERGEFSVPFASGWLSQRWGIASLMAMGMDDGDQAVGAAAAALRYLEETQFGGAGHVHSVRPLLPDGMLILDHSTQSHLELVEGDGASLFSVLNRNKTQMGRRLLRDWITHPLANVEEISFRQDCVEYLAGDRALLRKMKEALSRCRDMERALSRLSMKVGNPRDLGAVRDTLSALPALCGLIESGPLTPLIDKIPDMSGLELLLSSSLADDLPRAVSAGGVIRGGYDRELDDARDSIAHAEENLRAFETAERERTGLKVRVGINKVFGYYIEVGRNNADKIPDDYIRRQTVVSGERFVNERLKDIERRAFRAEREVGEREEGLYRDVLSRTLERSGDCQAASRAIATLDALRSLSEAARDNGYVRPAVDGSRVFDVKGARHPVIEKSLGNLPFTPNDITLDPDAPAEPPDAGHDAGQAKERTGSIAIITGPNMAGKSTYLRTAAVIAVMAHIGSFVPARSAHIGLIDRIFTRIGARDELVKGRSTFMVEMVETAGILRHVTNRSLVILDEIGRGTSTFDGMSIAWAVVEFLALNVEGNTKALFATHYHELTSLELPRLVNLSMAVEEYSGSVRFLHKVVPRPADRSYGIEVARLAGVPGIVIDRSRELLSEFESSQSKSKEDIRKISKKNLQKEIFFDAEREGVIEQLASTEPNAMTPMDALDLVFRLRKKSRKILGLK
ncbi:MAG: DNA mismatch repair protein MutS [Synergistaceae bacterium]|nr:DNA mismatch repair protein MutS [Synergistaceae bacterium]